MARCAAQALAAAVRSAIAPPTRCVAFVNNGYRKSMLRPPSQMTEVYASEPAAVRRARAALARFASVAGASPTETERVRLAVSEAVTNAVVHAYRGGPGTIHVTAALAGEELWVLVSDSGCGMQPRSDRPGLGLGLAVIAAVSDQMAVVPRSTGGTEVRIRFDLVSADDRRPVQRSGADDDRRPVPTIRG